MLDLRQIKIDSDDDAGAELCPFLGEGCVAMSALENVTVGQRRRALTISTLSFTVCFAVWTVFSIIGLKIKADLGLTDTQFVVRINI